MTPGMFDAADRVLGCAILLLVAAAVTCVPLAVWKLIDLVMP